MSETRSAGNLGLHGRVAADSCLALDWSFDGFRPREGLDGTFLLQPQDSLLGTIFVMMAILVILGTFMEWIALWMPQALGN